MVFFQVQTPGIYCGRDGFLRVHAFSPSMRIPTIHAIQNVRSCLFAVPLSQLQLHIYLPVSIAAFRLSGKKTWYNVVYEITMPGDQPHFVSSPCHRSPAWHCFTLGQSGVRVMMIHAFLTARIYHRYPTENSSLPRSWTRRFMQSCNSGLSSTMHITDAVTFHHIAKHGIYKVQRNVDENVTSGKIL